MIKKIPKNIKKMSSVILATESLKRGIKVVHINDYQKELAFLELSYKNHFEYTLGSNISKTTATGNYAMKNKALTKSLLARTKISVARGKLFHKSEVNEINEFTKKIGYPIVVKPFDDDHGNLVFIGIKTKKEYDNAIEKVLEKNNYVLVEKEFKGKEFRIIASRSKFIAATNRVPANIIGDGIHTVRELIKIKNKDPRRGEDYLFPLTKIKINNITRQCLLEQKIKMETILSSEEKIYLRKNSNLSTGGDSIDVTDQVHPEIRKIAVKAVKAIPGLAYAGVDLMTNKDISEKPTKNSYIIIEINVSPMISMHHFPYQGKSRDVAKEIIDILFPETKKNRQINDK
ncbi:hypothetical protein KAK05_01790 [Candidatus Parcubacteria bacterium]|nr:hypothetical protein [Candidatus Parcubacteria bacterium]